jgi:hypothetical protein
MRLWPGRKAMGGIRRERSPDYASGSIRERRLWGKKSRFNRKAGVTEKRRKRTTQPIASATARIRDEMASGCIHGTRLRTYMSNEAGATTMAFSRHRPGSTLKGPT